jgi:hypothetical protein
MSFDPDNVALPVHEPQHDRDKLRPFEEHGQAWVECLDCGRQWAVHGADLEVVTEGDGWCDHQDCS